MLPIDYLVVLEGHRAWVRSPASRVFALLGVEMHGTQRHSCRQTRQRFCCSETNESLIQPLTTLYVVRQAYNVQVKLIVVLSELPRTRETLLLRLMGRDRVLVDALEDLKNLPEDAQERCIAVPLLLHFRFEVQQRVEDDEQPMSAEIRAWYRAWSEEQERKQRESNRHAHDEGVSQGERTVLLRQLQTRFGTLPAVVTARVEAADTKAIEEWCDRVLTAQSLSDVFDALH